MTGGHLLRRAAAAAAATAAAVLLLPGCGGDGGDGSSTSTTAKAVDTHEVEELLVSTQKKASPEFDVRDASCPARVLVEDGTTFECTVVVEGVVVPYAVTLADVNQGSHTGRYDIRPAKAILSIPKLSAAVRSRVPNATVDCGTGKVKVLDVGQTFDCQVLDATGRHTVTLRVDDVNGNVTQVAAT